MNENDVNVDGAYMQPQLTQARVPLEEAGDALMTRDASGRIPIVIVPKRSGRVNLALLLVGVAVIVGGILLTASESNGLWTVGGLLLGIIVIALGVFQSFRVMAPEGGECAPAARGQVL